MSQTLFEKIIARQIPAKIAYEDDRYIAIHDISPQAPVHVLVIPKKVIPTLNDVEEADRELVGGMFRVAGKIMADLGHKESSPLAAAMIAGVVAVDKSNACERGSTAAPHEDAIYIDTRWNRIEHRMSSVTNQFNSRNHLPDPQPAPHLQRHVEPEEDYMAGVTSRVTRAASVPAGN